MTVMEFCDVLWSWNDATEPRPTWNISIIVTSLACFCFLIVSALSLLMECMCTTDHFQVSNLQKTNRSSSTALCCVSFFFFHPPLPSPPAAVALPLPAAAEDTKPSFVVSHRQSVLSSHGQWATRWNGPPVQMLMNPNIVFWNSFSQLWIILLRGAIKEKKMAFFVLLIDFLVVQWELCFTQRLLFVL